MELDEFKELWKSSEHADLQENEISKEKVNNIIMNATNTLGTIRKTNEGWTKFIALIYQLLIGVFVATIVINCVVAFMMEKESSFPILKRFTQILVYDLGLILMVKWTIWVQDYQNKIFEISNSIDLRDSLRTTILRFKKFYVVSMLGSIPISLAALYFGSYFSLPLLGVQAGFIVNISIAAIFTLVTLTWGHLYYKKTYFKWINNLKQNLDELEKQ